MKNKKNSSNLQIVYACNDKMYDGLYLSILSIVKRTKKAIDFFLLTADLSKLGRKNKPLTLEHANKIEEMIAKHNKKSSFTIIDCKEAYFDFFSVNGKPPKTKWWWTPYSLFRLLIPKLNVFKHKVLYLDCDTMACKDIDILFSKDIKKYEMLVTRDIGKHGEKCNNKYFNAGVLLINVDLIKKTKYFEKAKNLFVDLQPKYMDQDALNYTRFNLLFLTNDCFNRIDVPLKNDTVIKHFAGLQPKPWKRQLKNFYNLYNYNIWKEDIDEWQKNR